mgnify:CR=1 FL=1|tara:strand:+ start:278 stop:418 length:141 start_codon:yes stop_codon:yes gene_type:complete
MTKKDKKEVVVEKVKEESEDDYSTKIMPDGRKFKVYPDGKEVEIKE